jgi:hypothetical protein
MERGVLPNTDCVFVIALPIAIGTIDLNDYNIGIIPENSV